MEIKKQTTRLLYSKQEKTERNKRILLISIFCIAAIFQSGLRDIAKLPAENDTPNYFDMYKRMSNTSWRMLIDNFSIYSTDYGERDLGYPIFVKLTQFLCDDFTFFMFLTATIFMVPFSMLIYKYVKSSWGIVLAFLIFFSLYNNIINSFMRQAIALGLVLFGVKYIINSNWKKYFSLLLGAFVIHSSAVAAIPLYFLPQFTNSRRWLMVLLVISPLLMSMTPVLIKVLTIGTVYERYGMDDKLNPVNFIMFLFATALMTFVFFKKIKFVLDSNILLAGMLGTILLVPIIWMGGTMIRLSFYYSIFIVPLLPLVLDRMNIGKSKRSLAYFVGILFFLYMILK